jgi:hypothetical protein
VALHHELRVFGVRFRPNGIKESLELVIKLCVATDIMIKEILIEPVPFFVVKWNQSPIITFILIVLVITLMLLLPLLCLRKHFRIKKPTCSDQWHGFLNIVVKRLRLLQIDGLRLLGAEVDGFGDDDVSHDGQRNDQKRCVLPRLEGGAEGHLLALEAWELGVTGAEEAKTVPHHEAIFAAGTLLLGVFFFFVGRVIHIRLYRTFAVNDDDI